MSSHSSERASSPLTRPPLSNLSPTRGERLFGASAARLAGLTAVLLGWRPGEFWGATPAELAAVLGVMGGEAGGVSGEELRRLSELFPD